MNNNSYVGGGYTMHCAIYRVKIKWLLLILLVVVIRFTSDYDSPSDAKGSQLKLGALTGFTTYVKVQTRGSWSPDEE